jgi:hypothetical protein
MVEVSNPLLQLQPPAIIAAEYIASLQALLPAFEGSASVALAFHPQLRTRLANALAENFPRIRVEKGMFLDYTSSVDALAAAENALPQHGSVKNQLISYVDEYPITVFVRNGLAVELYELNRYDGDKPPHSLLEIPEFADAHALAETDDKRAGKPTLALHLHAKTSSCRGVCLSHPISGAPVLNEHETSPGKRVLYQGVSSQL